MYFLSVVVEYHLSSKASIFDMRSDDSNKLLNLYGRLEEKQRDKGASGAAVTSVSAVVGKIIDPGHND